VILAGLFISYSRRDIVFARKLTKAFEGQELDFWIDWEGIPPTVDWWKEIEIGIEEADIFIFLLSPDSINSTVCRQEIEHAVKNGKRLIPIVIREGNENEIPAALKSLNWIFLRKQDNFNDAFGKLMIAIKTDYEWVQTQRQLQVKALEWERSNYENSLLLRGKELKDAEFQFSTNVLKEPYPTKLQRKFITNSKNFRIRQRRIVAIIFTVVVIIITWLTYNPLKSWLSNPELPEWMDLTTFKDGHPRYISMDLRNPDKVYVSNLTPGVLYTSTDSGNRWSKVVIPEIKGEIIGLSVLETNIYALTRNAIWYSIDGGGNWDMMKNLPCNDDAELLSINVNPQNGNEIFVGANKGMVCHTPNGGITWEILERGFNGNSINSIATNGSLIILATEEGLWVKDLDGNDWNELSLAGCSNRSDEVTALAFTRPYEMPPPDGAYSFYSAVPGIGICDSDTLNLYGSTQISLPDESLTNISSIVIADIPGWDYEGYMTVGEKILRRRFWYSDDFEWWNIKIKSLYSKGE
jgi:hypothetical protein